MPKIISESQQRFNKIYDLNLYNYFKDLDLNNEMSIYDSIIKHLVDGDFDYDFYSNALDGVDELTKKKLGVTVRKYLSLVFFNSDSHLWQDSVNGVKGDAEFTCMRVLDNYNFLYEMIALKNGEDALKEIVKLKNEFANAGPVIENLRCAFGNDGVLKIVLLEMAKENGRYSELNDYQKYSLLNNPLGTVFCYENENTPRVILPNELAKNISERLGFDNKNITLAKLAEKMGEDAFEEVVQDISYEYISKNKSNENISKK